MELVGLKHGIALWGGGLPTFITDSLHLGIDLFCLEFEDV